MSIKKVKPSSRYKGGRYIPINEKKYIGQGPIIYRSGWEKKYCMHCDNTDDIVAWSSEPFAIEYFNKLTGKNHKYYPDFWIKVRKSNGTYKEYLIEIKPKSQTKVPTEPKKKTKQAVKNYKYAVETYIKNLAKARAAILFAESRSMKFIILTEDSLR
jgi:hypothetical protein